MIVEIDNRATEMGRDFDLPTVRRDDIAGLEERIDTDSTIELRLPNEAIESWRAQFNP